MWHPPTLGEVYYCRWPGVSESLIVTIAARLQQGWAVNKYGYTVWVAEVTSVVVSVDLLNTLENRKSSFEESRQEIQSNLEWGTIRRGVPYITVFDLLLEEFDTESFRPLWNKRGCCPKCGHKGEWRALALVCPYHGIYV